MSENIQSISQGTYTIGQTSANDSSLLVTQNENSVSILQGTVATSAGIVGDGTTQNPLRVDETVLWSGDRYWWADTSPLTTSENLSNFETIKVIAADDWELNQQEFYFPGLNFGFDISLIGEEGDNLVFKSSKFGVNGNQISLLSQSHCSIASNKTIFSTNFSTSFVRFIKIVGINRIANN